MAPPALRTILPRRGELPGHLMARPHAREIHAAVLFLRHPAPAASAGPPEGKVQARRNGVAGASNPLGITRSLLPETATSSSSRSALERQGEVAEGPDK